MADEVLVNLRIDQLALGTPASGDYGIFRDMLNSKTKRYPIPVFATSTNFEWDSVAAAAGDYDIDEVVTYGGNWYQSDINNNGSVPGVADWTLLTKSSPGVWYAAGVYSEDKPWVLSDHNGYPEIMYLRAPARPYVSSDIVAEEAAGDWISITQLLKDKVVDSSGASSVLNFLHASKKAFNLDTAIVAAHAFTLSNDEDAKEFEIYFTLTNAVGITMPASFVMPDGLFNNATKVWTPLDSGTYYGRGVKIGAVWILKLERINN